MYIYMYGMYQYILYSSHTITERYYYWFSSSKYTFYTAKLKGQSFSDKNASRRWRSS